MLLFFVWFWAVFLSIAHPFHVSVCELLHNPRTKRVELVQHIFLDDLEETLRNYAKDPFLDVMQPKDSITFDSLLRTYYEKNVTLWVNGKPKELLYLGHVRKEESMWSYLETKGKVRRFPRSIGIRNTVLFEQFSDQQNLIKLRVGNVDHSMVLHKDQPQNEASF